MTNNFGPCEICGTHDWSIVYRGDVRDGVFGRSRPDVTVGRCGGCGADRLDESVCPDDAFYETEAYRKKLEEELTAKAHYAVSDELQAFTHKVIWPDSLRGKTVADIGCAGGSFLDHVSGIASECTAIEPCSVYHDSLRSRGCRVFPYATDAVRGGLAGLVDLAVSIQVIEHVRSPRAFLEEIRPLLAPGGKLVISTPNRDDILMELLPADFRPFFYRVVHRWYFDAASLAECAQRAGFKVLETRFVHRYGMANSLAWLKDRRPTGRKRMDAITPLADQLWSSYIEHSEKADCIYMVLSPAIKKE
jgi:SAM-dependent methyltransferase